ncbi:hypothetical protein GCM10025868_14430 [Angustibacter aerolatus]|uniref:Uncharacterized protein n=1 Tax=Angustibacter aerolatus TaxID=1162965 RepID=A0ABQ6JFI5_9ACTN|nr:hypothetical protein [Angustibacter aerolatus]GMA86193.1 hypothetical protein GCM10025868_14430 [Angustibacter aerolatus]
MRDVRNVNVSPDFPTGAALLAGTWRRYAAAEDRPALPADATVVTITPARCRGCCR